MTTVYRITSLSRLNVRAILDVPAVHELFADVTATTAILAVAPAAAAASLRATIDHLPGRAHPKASLHAVLRKVEALLV